MRRHARAYPVAREELWERKREDQRDALREGDELREREKLREREALKERVCASAHKFVFG